MQEDTPQLMRTRSDVGVRRRGNVRTPSDQRRIRRHRFSINGHYYNHKVQCLGERMGETWEYPDPFLDTTALLGQ